jgi:F0F1-type ATP synthase assembly protein I
MAGSIGKFARYAAYGTQIAMSPLVGAFLGHLLDVYFHTDPLLAIIMTMLGVALSALYLVRLVNELRPR